MLIVDDDPETIAVLTRVLLRNAYPEVAVAGSVTEAIEQLDAAPPDVVLHDLSLSLGEGHALLRHVRREPRWSALPVLMLTGHHSAAAIQTAAQEGATGFIPQPLHGVEIVFKIEQAVREAPARAAEREDLARPDPATDDQRPGPHLRR